MICVWINWWIWNISQIDLLNLCPIYNTYLFENNAKLTSKTVRSKDMFAPLYNPTACSHMLIMTTSETAIENKADFRSKSWSSPLSRPSVPSTSITSNGDCFAFEIQIPFVVWDRPLFMSITSNEVSNKWFKRVPALTNDTFSSALWTKYRDQMVVETDIVQTI